MTRFSIIFVSVLVVLVFVGCSRRPAGMPETFPCKITVANNGVPMPECDVRLHRAGGNGSLRRRSG